MHVVVTTGNFVIMSQGDERVVEIGVGRQSMIDQLDYNMIMAEQCRSAGPARQPLPPTGNDQRLPHGTFGAAGQDHPVAVDCAASSSST